MRKISLFIAIFASLAVPALAAAQVFNQNQIITTPYGNNGFVVSTSTSGGAKLGATSTPFFTNFSFGHATGTQETLGALTVTGQTTLATTLTGLLKATSGVVTTAILGTDYVNGSGTSGNCVQWGASNSLGDAGSPCGSGSGGVTSLAAAYPILVSGSTGAVTISTAFGTTTNWGLGSNKIVVTGATGIPFGAASSTLNLPNSALQNSSIVINGTTFNLGDSKTITAASSTLLGDSNVFSGNDTFNNLITGSISGNAGTATKLATGRTIAVTGDLTYTSPSFDGSTNVTAAGTLATVNGNVGSFTNANITVNGKGLITAASNGTASTNSVFASSTNFTAGQIPYATNSNGTPITLGAVSTSTPTVTGPITYGGTLGSFVGGVAGAFGCTTAASGVAGCLNSTDWATFNNKISSTSLSANPPIRYNSTTGLFDFTGLATTSQPSSSNVLVSNGLNGVYGAATTSLTASGVLSLSQPISVLGASPSALTITGGSNGQVLGWLSGVPTWTASTSVVAGTGISVATAGAVNTVTNTGVTSLTANEPITASASTGAVTLSLLRDWIVSNGNLIPTTTRGIIVSASSTIGGGTQTTGLTINGGATTTGNMNILGSLAIGTSTIGTSNGSLTLYNTNTAGVSPYLTLGGNPAGDTDFWVGRQNTNDATNNDSLQTGPTLVPGTTPFTTLNFNGNYGVGSTSPFARLSVQGNPNDAVLNTTLFAVGSSTASATTTLFSINNIGSTTLSSNFGACSGSSALTTNSAGTITCGAISGTGLIGTTGQVAYFSGTNTAVGTSTVFIATNSDVGIGSVIPTTKLQVDAQTNSPSVDSISLQNTGVSTLGNIVGIRFQYNTAIPGAIRLSLTNGGSGAGRMGLFTSSDATPQNLLEQFSITSGGNIGVASTSPFAKFGIQANNGDGNTTLFAVASSTQTATTTLFSINNIGAFNFQTVNGTSTFQDRFGTNLMTLFTGSTTASIFTVGATTSTPLNTIKLFDVDQYGHLTASSTGAAPTITCSPTNNPTLGANSNDVTGDLTTGTLSTSCTVTFARAYATTPEIMVTAGSTASIVGVTSRSTTSFTIGLGTAATGDDISYFVIQP